MNKRQSPFHGHDVNREKEVHSLPPHQCSELNQEYMMLMTNQKEMLDRKIQMVTKEKNITSDLDLRARPPFTIVIMNYECPAKFKALNLYP